MLTIQACKYNFDSIFATNFDALAFVYQKLYRYGVIDLDGMFHMLFELWMKFYKNDLLYGQKEVLLQELVLESPCMDWFNGRDAKNNKKEHLTAKIKKMASHIAHTNVMGCYVLKSFDLGEIQKDPHYKKEYVH